MGVDMAITERLIAARQTTNLKGKSYTETDVDVVGASGLAQVGVRTVGALASRQNLTRRDLATIAEKMAFRMRRRSTNERWHYQHNDLTVIAAHALAYWHDSKCKVCGGHGLEMDGQLPVGPCDACDGTGQAPLPTDIETVKQRPADKLEAALRYALGLIDKEIGEHLRQTRHRLG
jgi:hypothetical protein